jgi:hypothetical protein
MKSIVVTLFLAVFLPGCKKAIENLQQDLVIKAMTDGQWKITNFEYNSANITSQFSTYTFQYYSNKTVDAINNGVVEIKGAWDGNASTMTTSANFTNPPPPLDLINGYWHIDNTSWTYVVASQIMGSNTKIMRLDKL